jgi:hypothetical protein
VKKSSIIILCMLLVTLCVGCAHYTDLNFKELEDFKDDIKKQFDYIKDVDVNFYQGGFNFIYSLKTKVEKEKLDAVMEETKNFFTDSNIKSKFKEIYKNKFDEQYPGVYISFDKAEQMYEARYKNSNGIDDYKTWVD